MFKYFDRYIIKEIIPPFFIGLLISTFVLLMNQILTLSEIFITRGIPLKPALLILFYLIPSILAFTIPMAVLMGTLGGLSRLSSDSEVMAFKTLGIRSTRLLQPVLLFSLCGWLLTSYFALYLAPRFNHRMVQTLTRSVLTRIQFKIHPREFNESIPDTVIFIQGLSSERDWENVFVYFSEPREEPRVIAAERGRLRFYPERKRAVLELFDGTLHSYSSSDPEKYSVTTFERDEEEVSIESFYSTVSEKKHRRDMDIGELFAEIKTTKPDLAQLHSERDQSENKAFEYERKLKEYVSYWVEVHKKFALPFACLIFGFLGLPLGASTRKGGRTSGFTISIGIILVYYILITAGEKMAMEGKLSAWLGMWGPNFLLFFAALWLFFRSMRESSVFPFRLRTQKEKVNVSRGKKKRFSRAVFRLSLRFPNILDRYIIRKYLAIFALVFSSLLVISVIVTFFERIDNVYEHEKSIALLFEYIRFSLPEFLYYIFPITALTAALLSMGLLTKSNEITAMKTCGLSLYRIILPVILLAVVASFFSFYNQENILPYANKKAEEIWNKINDRPVRSYSYLDRRWVLSRGRNRIYHYNYFDPEKSVFSQLSIYDFDSSSWSVSQRIHAVRARLNGGRLSLEDCWVRHFSDGRMIRFEKNIKLDLSVSEDRSFFLKEWKEPSQMSYGELRTYIQELDERNFDTVKFKVDLNSKVSFPFVCLIMTLIGIPFAFSLGKKGTLVGIGLSIVIAMIYWGTIAVFQGLGYVGYLSAFLSAWGPNLVFGLIGLYLLFTLRT